MLAMNSVAIPAFADPETENDEDIGDSSQNEDYDIILSIPDIKAENIEAGKTMEIPVKLEKHTVGITSFKIVFSSDCLDFDSDAGGFLAENENTNNFDFNVEKINSLLRGG